MQIKYSQLWVRDQDEALDFWTNKVGLEVKQDVTMAEMGDFRWLVVGDPGEENGIVLMAVPGGPMIDDATRAQIEDLVSKGLAGTVFITTDDCRSSYEELKSRGVEFTSEPEEMPYGIDCGFRDPSGNSARLTEVTW
jgi:predicted enzyme related to lactoylglutathione lyase